MTNTMSIHALRERHTPGPVGSVDTERIAILGRTEIAVAVCGTHLCMSVRMDAARTTTEQIGGRFEHDPVHSQRFLTIAGTQRGDS